MGNPGDAAPDTSEPCIICGHIHEYVDEACVSCGCDWTHMVERVFTPEQKARLLAALEGTEPGTGRPKTSDD